MEKRRKTRKQNKDGSNEMEFIPIDLNTWKRKEYYLHFLNEVRCSYSVTVNLDISSLKGQRLYPAMIWLLSRTVNEMQEFRMAITKTGLGYYTQMHPCYTIFNKDNETFSGIWAYDDENYESFLKAYEKDVDEYGCSKQYTPKPNTPVNSFYISMVPWIPFTSVTMNISGENKDFTPIFTMGKTFDLNGKCLLPLAIQVHHAVCDGYHVGKFVEKLQDKINSFDSH